MSDLTQEARVFLVGAGPGDPDLLTLRAARLLGEAETVVYDRLVSPGVLDLVSPTATRVFAGKASRDHVMPQEAINELLVTLARYNAGQAGTLHQALIHEQERSGAAWALEWMVLPQMILATARSLATAQTLITSVDRIGKA